MNTIFKPVVTNISSTSWEDDWFWSHCWIKDSDRQEHTWSENWFLGESAGRSWSADMSESIWV